LEAHRPEGAAAVFVAPVPEDLSQLAREAPSSFDDLRDPVDPPAAVGEAAVDPEAAELAARDMVREDVAESDGAEGQDGADGADGAGAESDGAESDLAAGPDGSAPSGDSEDHHDGAAAEGSDGDRDSVGDDGVSVDATVAMTRDGAMASEASDRSSFVPHPGT
jgi:hypothetical protein